MYSNSSVLSGATPHSSILPQAVDTNDPGTVAVVGLGYVGLPLATAFGAVLPTIGFDIAPDKLANYREGRDPTGEVRPELFAQASMLSFTDDPADLARADFIVVAVPTPVDAACNPDFGPLKRASASAGSNMKRGAVVVFESTVYPGATEEVCIPILEATSGMRWKEDFHVGYSPERINPADPERTLSSILKVVSADDEATLARVAALYSAVVKAGVCPVSSIKVAEAAKVIENTQRDLNIALMNELAIICERIGIDTHEVLKAAATKWNFLCFEPGLVGGHCIGVDPYYLTHKAQSVGYHPQVILAGRRINDGMARFIAEKTIKQMVKAGRCIRGSAVNVVGLAFKENCPDLRNSKAAELVAELQSFGLDVHVHDPLAASADAVHEYGIRLESWEELPRAQALVVAVPHRELLRRPLSDYTDKLEDGGCFVDIKGRFELSSLQQAGYSTWRL